MWTRCFYAFLASMVLTMVVLTSLTPKAEGNAVSSSATPLKENMFHFPCSGHKLSRRRRPPPPPPPSPPPPSPPPPPPFSPTGPRLLRKAQTTLLALEERPYVDSQCVSVDVAHELEFAPNSRFPWAGICGVAADQGSPSTAFSTVFHCAAGLYSCSFPTLQVEPLIEPHALPPAAGAASSDWIFFGRALQTANHDVVLIRCSRADALSPLACSLPSSVVLDGTSISSTSRGAGIRTSTSVILAYPTGTSNGVVVSVCNATGGSCSFSTILPSAKCTGVDMDVYPSSSPAPPPVVHLACMGYNGDEVFITLAVLSSTLGTVSASGGVSATMLTMALPEPDDSWSLDYASITVRSLPLATGALPGSPTMSVTVPRGSDPGAFLFLCNPPPSAVCTVSTFAPTRLTPSLPLPITGPMTVWDTPLGVTGMGPVAHTVVSFQGMLMVWSNQSVVLDQTLPSGMPQGVSLVGASGAYDAVNDVGLAIGVNGSAYRLDAWVVSGLSSCSRVPLCADTVCSPDPFSCSSCRPGLSLTSAPYPGGPSCDCPPNPSGGAQYVSRADGACTECTVRGCPSASLAACFSPNEGVCSVCDVSAGWVGESVSACFVAPNVSAILPEPGSGVISGTELEIVFDGPGLGSAPTLQSTIVDGISVTCDGGLLCSGQACAGPSGTVKWDPDGYVVSMTPSFVPGECTVEVDFSSAGGVNGGESASSTFQVLSLILHVDPSGSSVGLEAPVTIFFDELMGPDSLVSQDAFRLQQTPFGSDNSTIIPLTRSDFQWSVQGRVVKIEPPEGSWPDSHWIDLVFDKNLTAFDGSIFNRTYVHTFDTVRILPEYEALGWSERGSGVYSVEDLDRVTLSASLVVFFSKSMDPLSVPGGLSIVGRATKAGTAVVRTRRGVVDPGGPVPPPSRTPSPPSRASGWVSPRALIVEDETGELWDLEWVSSWYRRAVLTPRSDLRPDTVYTVTFDPDVVLDTTGNRITVEGSTTVGAFALSHSITTIDFVAPRITSVVPRLGDAGILIDTQLIVQFDETVSVGSSLLGREGRPHVVVSFLRERDAEGGGSGGGVGEEVLWESVTLYDNHVRWTWSDLANSFSIAPPEGGWVVDARYRVGVFGIEDVFENAASFGDVVLEFGTECGAGGPMERDWKRVCVCKTGLWGPEHGPCAPCPANAYCGGGGAEPRPLPGYFASANGDTLQIIPCSPPSACLGNNTCTSGYDNAADGCSSCDKARSYRMGGRCVSCPERPYLRWVGIGALAVAVAVVMLIGVVRFNRRAREKAVLLGEVYGERLAELRRKVSTKWAVLSIGLNFWQILALFGRIDLNWPGPVQNTLSALSILNLEFELLATDCSVTWGYSIKWVLAMLSPVVFVVVWMAGIGVWVVVRALRAGEGGSGPEVVGFTRDAVNAVVSACMVMLSLGYLMLAGKALEPLDCSYSFGEWRLDAEPKLRCFEAWWWALFPGVVIAVALYVVGIPVLFAWALWRNRRSLLEPSSVASLRYGVITSRYRGGMGYYELVIMGRKLGVVGAQLFFTAKPVIQATVIQVALIFALAIHARVQPYVRPELNRVESGLIICGLVVLTFGVMMFHTGSVLVAWITVGIIVVCTAVVVGVVIQGLVIDAWGGGRRTSNKVGVVSSNSCWDGDREDEMTNRMSIISSGGMSSGGMSSGGGLSSGGLSSGGSS